MGIIQSLVELNPQIPVAVHLDHGNIPQTCKEVIELGCTSVMIDGSLREDGKTESDYEYNMGVTKEVVEYAHERGITVEAEMGRLGGLEEGRGGKENTTDPEELLHLYRDCLMDACAIAWGTRHGAYKGVAGEPPKLRHDIIVECHKIVPGLHLVSHGSSSVPADLVARINSYGVIRKYVSEDGHRHITGYGKDFDLTTTNLNGVLDFLFEAERMPQSVGVPIEDLQQAIKEGIVKINVDTDGRMYVTEAVLSVLEAQPTQFDPRKYLGPARDAITKFVKERMIAFGSAGHASDITPITLEEMAKRYAA